MINEDRFWDAAITEAVQGNEPPDVTPRVLAKLADADTPESEPTVAKKAGALLVLRRLGEFAAVAGVLLAIAWLTGLITWPDGTPPETSDPTELAAAPGAEYTYKDGVVQLDKGWLAVATGAPDVHCGGSNLSHIDGRVLVHAGSAPSREQVEVVEDWLKANKLEIEMIHNKKRWLQGVGLAVLILSGSAMLDGQEVEGPEPKPVVTEDWHVVRSVMDIDELPEGAKYVSANEISAAHLDFLSEVESIEGIRMHYCSGLRMEHLESLKKLPKLRWLDIRGAHWEESPDLTPLSELKKLKRLGIDLVPAHITIENEEYIRSGHDLYTRRNKNAESKSYGFDVGTESLPILGLLSKAGVEIELGTYDPESKESLENVLKALPTVRDISIENPTSAQMKVLAAHKPLRSLELRRYSAGQVGLAYIARGVKLEQLSILASRITVEELHQISRMDLRVLRIVAYLNSSPEQCFEKIASMQNLRELELGDMELSDESVSAFKKLGALKKLERFRAERNLFDGEVSGGAYMLAQVVPAKLVEAESRNILLTKMEWLPVVLHKGDAAKNLEVIRLEFEDVEFSRENFDTSYAEPFKTFPNLKRIEIRRGGFDNPGSEDQYANWLKENLPDIEVVVTP